MGSQFLLCMVVQQICERIRKKGHFGPDLNFEILICTEITGNQPSFTACFMFIAV